MDLFEVYIIYSSFLLKINNIKRSTSTTFFLLLKNFCMREQALGLFPLHLGFNMIGIHLYFPCDLIKTLKNIYIILGTGFKK